MWEVLTLRIRESMWDSLAGMPKATSVQLRFLGPFGAIWAIRHFRGELDFFCFRFSHILFYLHR